MGQPPSITSFTECKCRQHLKTENQGGSKVSCLLNLSLNHPILCGKHNMGRFFCCIREYFSFSVFTDSVQTRNGRRLSVEFVMRLHDSSYKLKFSHNKHNTPLLIPAHAGKLTCSETGDTEHIVCILPTVKIIWILFQQRCLLPVYLANMRKQFFFYCF